MSNLNSAGSFNPVNLDVSFTYVDLDDSFTHVDLNDSIVETREKSNFLTKLNKFITFHFKGLDNDEKYIVIKFNRNFKNVKDRINNTFPSEFKKIQNLTRKTFFNDRRLVDSTTLNAFEKFSTSLKTEIAYLSIDISDFQGLLNHLKPKDDTDLERKSLNQKCAQLEEKINLLKKTKTHYTSRLELTESYFVINLEVKKLKEELKNNDNAQNVKEIRKTIHKLISDFSTSLINSIEADSDLMKGPEGSKVFANKKLKNILKDKRILNFNKSNEYDKTTDLNPSEIKEILKIAFPGLKSSMDDIFQILKEIEKPQFLKINQRVIQADKIAKNIIKNLKFESKTENTIKKWNFFSFIRHRSSKSQMKSKLAASRAKTVELYSKFDFKQLELDNDWINFAVISPMSDRQFKCMKTRLEKILEAVNKLNPQDNPLLDEHIKYYNMNHYQAPGFIHKKFFPHAGDSVYNSVKKIDEILSSTIIECENKLKSPGNSKIVYDKLVENMDLIQDIITAAFPNQLNPAWGSVLAPSLPDLISTRARIDGMCKLSTLLFQAERGLKSYNTEDESEDIIESDSDQEDYSPSFRNDNDSDSEDDFKIDIKPNKKFDLNN